MVVQCTTTLKVPTLAEKQIQASMATAVQTTALYHDESRSQADATMLAAHSCILHVLFTMAMQCVCIPSALAG